ncbi:type IV pilin N-terminal domain-containing protein [Halapricum hydrolyticum]|uniref:Type IV pilin N-terminal domain-containing protein n=1 Tax=Halapricum hydrolyticum TaxID=2979991 RepID=A0AAE3LF97_9EURY|nr:type IV pilin N-terminal domain-containing protein [Halapricum hydrolyticum]MCU4719162.1 type IV pilin N-terminal domain-containing protein [Halapricum hydrolyticum]MCU4727352.1 type IV pilin N-terminal domain-containing protein [Halapricum hydrolyticum]
MQLKELITDDDAVSPVIGVILMVAITVILAAVIASFVLGLGDTTNTTPQASFDFDYDQGDTSTTDSFGNTGTDGLLTITHESGDSIEATQLYIRGSSDSSDVEVATDSSNSPKYSSGDKISAGDTINVGVANGDTVRVVYEDSSGDSSSTLGSWEGPDA